MGVWMTRSCLADHTNGAAKHDGPPVTLSLAQLIASALLIFVSHPPVPFLQAASYWLGSSRAGSSRPSSPIHRVVQLFVGASGGRKMPEERSEKNAAENIMSSIMDTIADNLPSSKSDEGGGSVADQAQRLFGGSVAGGGKRNLHHVLGGGKPADVLLWRNKKISSTVLAAATAVWVFFEWLDYHFLTILCFALVLGLAVQFAWSTVVRSPSRVPRVELPEEAFASAGAAVGAQVNRALRAVQDVSCGRNLKQFLLVIAGLFAAAVIGSWCNLLTVVYIGFVCAHTLPVLYEKNQDQVDDFLYNVLGLLQNQYQKLSNKGVLKGGVSRFTKRD